MAHTLPDYTSKWRNNTIFNVADMGELAARLKSIDIFDRRGNIVHLDDFEAAALFWNTVTNGAGASATIVADWARNGSQSCKLIAGAGVGGFAGLYRYFGVPVLGNMGMEISFTVDADTKTVLFRFTHYDGTNYHMGQIDYQHNNNRFILTDQDLNTQVILTPADLEDANKTFHTFKMVINTDTVMYNRMLIDDTEVDISAHGLYSFASATDPSMHVTLRHVSDHAAAKTIWIDDFIMTQNEV